MQMDGPGCDGVSDATIACPVNFTQHESFPFSNGKPQWLALSFTKFLAVILACASAAGPGSPKGS